MSDVMPKEQYDFICKAQKDMLLHTNMTSEEAWDFGFRCWQMGYAKMERKTNADKIRSMSDEELAEYIEPRWFDCSDFCEDFDAGCAYTCKHNKGAEFLLNWLKSPTTD